MGKPCPKYTAEFKRRAVQLYNERGTTYAEVARLTQSTRRAWPTGSGGPEWGDRAVWEELRRKDPYPFWLD